MHDSFGDGWQTKGNGGPGISITIDGVETQVGMCSPYEAQDFDCTPWPDDIDDPTAEFFDATAFVTIPVGSEVATWVFPGDTFSEISFEIFAPDGSLLFQAGTGETAPGLLPFILCANNM
jgi:hypothetical protein